MEPCMCGDTECWVCGPLQGYGEEDFEDDMRCTCGIPVDEVELCETDGIMCSDCYQDWLETELLEGD